MHVTDRPRRLVLQCDPNERGTRRERLAIAEHCAGRLAQETVHDMQLVASELVTNAFEHGARGVVTLDVTLDGESATVTVTSTGNSSGIQHPSTWSFPEPTQVSGRGLAVARSMSRAIELHTAVARFAPDRTAITAHLGPRPRHAAPAANTAPVASTIGCAGGC